MRACIPPGATDTRSPTRSGPSISVPVTTVPKPLIVNARSIGSRARPMSRTGGSADSAPSSADRSASSPAPVAAEQRTMAAPASDVGASSSSTSASTRSSHSPSAKSHFVSATTPCVVCSRSRMAKCSRVCGITPSSAATTNSARSMPPTPASMFLMKRSWPGTSTRLTSRPLGSVHHAKPRSMVRPRAFSSAQRSGSMPLSASTSVLLPWSTCPAVPMTYMASG